VGWLPNRVRVSTILCDCRSRSFLLIKTYNGGLDCCECLSNVVCWFLYALPRPTVASSHSYRCKPGQQMQFRRSCKKPSGGLCVSIKDHTIATFSSLLFLLSVSICRRIVPSKMTVHVKPTVIATYDGNILWSCVNEVLWKKNLHAVMM